MDSSTSVAGAAFTMKRERLKLRLWQFAFLSATLLLVVLPNLVASADLVIRIPGDLSQQDGFYRLYYKPEVGSPEANTTFRPQSISDVIKFSRGLPGTKYDFWLYYSTTSISDWLTWTASITTAPDPPSNLSIDIKSGKVADIEWNPPSTGGYSGFKLKVIPLNEAQKSIRNIVIREDSSPFQLRDLTPGATYEIQLYTVYENKESAAYISTNFTTQPNTPGRFIVWFRNETTLLVLWQPPYPAGVYSDYKVSIDPPDAEVSETYVTKDGDPPGPAQAAFNGLIPGRAYNISVETVSEGQISAPTTAQYRTVPWRPYNVTFDESTTGADFFEVRWSGPREITEFDRYQVAIGIRRKTPQIVERGAPLRASFTENLKPGLTYQVVVKTVSGSVASWPATGNVTTRPLPVLDTIQTHMDEETKEVTIIWEPNPESNQEQYKVTYHDLEATAFNGDSSYIFVPDPYFSLDNLNPGRNYSIAIQAVSKGIESVERSMNQATRPASPIIEDVAPIPGGLNISWKSDVTSKQDKYVVVYIRNDTGRPVNVETREPRVTLEGLYPGAGYEIKVYALSHSLLSEPHISFTAIYPNSIQNLTIERVVDNKITLSWLPPQDSLFTGYVIRYRPYGDNRSRSWSEIADVTETTYELDNLSPGEQFEIEVNSISHHVESTQPLTVAQTIKPQAVRDVEPVLGAENITLSWPRPEGRVDRYFIKWYPLSNVEDIRVKEIPGDVQTEGIGRTIDDVIGDLHPGVDYMFEITTEAHGLRSETVRTSIRTMPLITSEITVVNKQDTTDALTLKYTPTPLTRSLFDTYRFKLSDDTLPLMEKAAQDPERKVTFVDLTPGRLYTVSLWTVSGGVTSLPLEATDRLHPEPVEDIAAADIKDKEITLYWKAPKGDFDSFEVQYLDTKDRLINNSTDTTSITIFGLRPFRNYTFTVITKSGSSVSTPRRSTPVSAEFETKESVPGSLTVFEPFEVHPSRITFIWELSTGDANGVLTGFTIQYGPKPTRDDEPFIPEESREFGPDAREGNIEGLAPGQLYTFQIQAKTQVGYGAWVRWEQRMPVWAPPVPNRDVFPTELEHAKETVAIRFRRNYFSDANGKVIAYAIIVAEDYRKSTHDKPNLPKWQDVQQFRSWPPYQVSDAYYPFNNSSVEDFSIGTDQDCKSKVASYCNGPLKTGTTYRFKIRAYTTRDKHSETNWSQPITTDPDNTAALIGIIIPVILIIIIVFVVIFARRMMYDSGSSNCMKRRLGGGGGMHPGDNISLPDSVMETSRPVKLKDFADHYKIMSADSDFRFSEEYEELKHVGRDKPCTAADIPVNRPKNRFTNILPYDHSRVKLQPTDDEEGSDFINANFVPGHNSPREFIVTQGPLHSTRDEFWRMCWETNSRAIVMLTRCVEKGREKCDHYWPYDTQPVYYGDIQVTILN
jgi:receptor-type tyrosine-protein phosphatase beta